MKPLETMHIDTDMQRDAALNAWSSPIAKKWKDKLTYKNYEEMIEEGWDDQAFMCNDYCANLAEICTAEILDTKWEPSSGPRSWDVRKDGVFYSVKSIYDPYRYKVYFPYGHASYRYETENHPDSPTPCEGVWFWEFKGVGGYELDALCWGMHDPKVCYELVEDFGRRNQWQGIKQKSIKEMSNESTKQVHASY